VHSRGLTGADVRGVDVHQDKGNPDWNRAFAAGVRFVWLKVSEGAGGHPNEKILPWYRHNAPAAKAAGVRLGGYHFLTTGIPASSPKEEAEFFLSRLSLARGDLLPACDFEQEPPDATQALAFLRLVKERIGIKPILYVGSNFLDRALSGSTQAERQALKSFPLWFADYGPKNDGSDHGIRHDTHGFKVVVHQFTSKGKIAGVNSPTDLDRLIAPSLDAITFKRAAPKHAPAGTIPKMLKRGQRGRSVKELKRDLRAWFEATSPGEWGRLEVADSDFFGAALEEAVKVFQKRKGLEVNGRVGKRTRDALAAAILV
jgi:GH25 family lysozyme M1 (1,4-beta-N-acetylmuramidase)